jgi:hypothetical protein
MLQSWGRVTGFQAESSKVGDWALGASDWRKRQLVVNRSISRGLFFCAVAKSVVVRSRAVIRVARRMKFLEGAGRILALSA